jgi:hypothetical protein
MLVTRSTVYGPRALDRPGVQKDIIHRQCPAQDRTRRGGRQAKLLASIFSVIVTALPRLLERLGRCNRPLNSPRSTLFSATHSSSGLPVNISGCLR